MSSEPGTPSSIPSAAPGTSDAEPVTVALVGRPNCGKSSLFNRLTGGNAHVGNFPGITVDMLEGETVLADGRAATIVDLPGLYSIGAAADPQTDEGIARTYIDGVSAAASPLLLIQVVDSTQLALGLRLTRELTDRAVPLLVVATQLDVLHGEGRELDAGAIEAAIGVPVIAVSSRDPKSREVILRAVAKYASSVRRNAAANRPWDPDKLARSAVSERSGIDGAARKRRTRTARADAVLLHPVLGPVLFVGLMATLFAAVFLVADPVSSALDLVTQAAGRGIVRVVGPGLFGSFVTDGLLGGAGTVLAFLPQIVILTIAMELLEATGYLARGAFLLDRLLRTVGLGGRAFIPLLTAHACAVPAIAATRIMRDPRERLSTMMVLPLMACSARIPTYSLLISTFFAHRGAWFKSALFVALYFGGIASGLVASFLIRRTVTRGRRLPLVLEMPAYRAPEATAVAQVASRASSRFLRDVGTTILIASAVLWALLAIPRPDAHGIETDPGASSRVVRMHHSLAAGIGHALEPITQPLGFDWRINVGLIGSFGARELMVSTLGVIFGIENADQHPNSLSQRVRDARRPDGTPAYSSLTAMALMAFFVFACQCMSTVAALRRETKTWRWPVFVLVYTYAAAYLAALLVYQGGRLLGLG